MKFLIYSLAIAATLAVAACSFELADVSYDAETGWTVTARPVVEDSATK